MSYILDALRKSDQLRQRGAAPTLLLGQATATAPKRPAPLWYGLLALVLLGAGIAIGWLRPWQSEPAAPAPTAVAAKPTEAAQSKLAPAAPDMTPKPQPELQLHNPAPATPAVSAPAPAQSQAAAVRIEKQQAPAVARAPERAAAPAPELASGGRSVAAAPAPRVMMMAELPLAIQQELPPMSISVHAYSGKSAERLVGINGRLLHEGDQVAPGLRLEQITPDGMILSYKEYRFRRGVH
ncbi:MAG: general secretion pathway protein GspB [Burkholderiales bacterium]|nr:general secretion pathway protein GspB [Burkholderiales bacterium]